MLKRFALAAIAALFMTSSASADIWVNEIHYDNTGGDSGEFVEIAIAPNMSGVDLSDVTLTLYNGNGGASYDTKTLQEMFDQNGSTTVNGFTLLHFNYASNGIQNGPDGWSLSSSSEVFEFLSYEDSFPATNGAASGMTSTEIGVFESSGTAVGFSLQLQGTGDSSDDFTWATPQANTAGAVNTGQTLAAVPEPASAAVLGLVAVGGLFVRRRK